MLHYVWCSSVGEYVKDGDNTFILKTTAVYGSDVGANAMTWEPTVFADSKEVPVTLVGDPDEKGYHAATFVFRTDSLDSWSTLLWDPAIGALLPQGVTSDNSEVCGSDEYFDTMVQYCRPSQVCDP